MSSEPDTIRVKSWVLIDTKLRQSAMNEAVFKAFVYGQFIDEVKYYYYESTVSSYPLVSIAFAKGEDATMFKMKNLEKVLAEFLRMS